MPEFRCPKFLLNGPCGGVGLDGSCEVDRQQTCVFVNPAGLTVSVPAPEGAYTYSPPADWRHHPTSQPGRPELLAPQITLPIPPDLDPDRPWRSGSIFERRLRAGQFVVTCEVNPRDSADPGEMIAYVRTLIGNVDAVHVSDNSFASPHMSCLASAGLIEAQGVETILHLTCRDRNRMMLQADVLGACALGVKNILCLGGDHPAVGDHPDAKPVFDLDSVGFIHVVRQMRDQGMFMSGRAIQVPPRLFIGAADAPTAPPLEYRAYRLGKKVTAGADFIVTQIIFDMQMLREHMQRIRDLGLDKKVHILVGVGALAGADLAEAINRHAPGVVVPEHVMQRLRGVPPGQRKREGIRICVEQIHELREMPGISGIDLMDLKPDSWFPSVEIAETADLLPRPALPKYGSLPMATSAGLRPPVPSASENAALSQ
jgi:methylenetetrahydrofolate reductase (NADPH)